MEKEEKMLAVSRLVLELTLVGGAATDMDALLGKTLDLLQGLPGVAVGAQAALLLANPRGELVQVAQIGLTPAWAGEARWLGGLNLDLDTPLGVVVGESGRYLVMPLRETAQRMGLALFASAPGWQPEPPMVDFLETVARALFGLVVRNQINETLRVREVELNEARAEALYRLGAASEYRDSETGIHVMRMTHYAVAIAKAYGLPAEAREQLAITAPMHDVGKIGIADAILLKPGRLSADEFDVMKTHTEIGERLLKGSDALIAAAREVASAHHEHWDGSGYPRGLRGEAIPISARICAVADVLDALTSHRSYKEAWSMETAVEWVRKESGRQFDPAVVRAFEWALPEILRIRELYRDDIIDPNQVVALPKATLRGDAWVPWDDSLSVGIDVIDEHHRYLVSLVNDMYDIVAGKRGASEVARVLKSLGQYAQVHFSAEERMMEHYGHDGLTRQQHQHHHFLDRVKLFAQELHSAPLTAPHDVLDYLKHWLIAHIRVEDARLRELRSA